MGSYEIKKVCTSKCPIKKDNANRSSYEILEPGDILVELKKGNFSRGQQNMILGVAFRMTKQG